jgi:DNA-binding HxlR family transcriptional regulator
METQQQCKKANLAMQDTLAVISGKWKLVILYVLLRHDKKRFRELSRDTGMSSRVLSKELQELEANQLVTRTVCDTKPITVEYAATPYCRTLDDVISAMHNWGTQHREVITGRKQLDITQSDI